MNTATISQAVSSFRQILGVRFFLGSAQDTIERLRSGGLLVVPSGPGMKDLADNPDYRDALLHSDLAITDSALMVTLWNLLNRDSIPRLSGLEYLKVLLRDEEVRTPGNTLWIMARPESARKNLAWLREQGITVFPKDVYLAPVYGAEIEDEALLKLMNAKRYRHVVVTIGGGNQERLGLYLKRNINYRPAIHCIGAAIAFLSGDQVRIPYWADRLRMGWLLRCLWRPKSYIPRYWEARKLVWIMFRYRAEMPPLAAGKQRQQPAKAA